MPTPNLPPGFDFTDPDIYAERLPVDELAADAQGRTYLVAGADEGQSRVRRQRLLGGDQAQGRQGDLAGAATCFSSNKKTALPRYRDEADPASLEGGKVVLLNQDAPHHTHLRKIVSRAFTPRAIESLRDELRERARQHRKAAAAEGSGDFVEQVSCELPLQAIAGPDGRAAGRPQ